MVAKTADQKILLGRGITHLGIAAPSAHAGDLSNCRASAISRSVPKQELRRLAHFQLQKERPDHTLQSAALVHEAYLRLIGLNTPQWESRTHFFVIASQLMRQILFDYARRHKAVKRSGSICKLSLAEAKVASRRKDVDVVALDDALNSLAKIDPRQSRVVELRFFAGLSLQEISQAMEIAPATVQRDWTTARGWFHREISRDSRL